ncbi:unnamed protein product [Rotaria sp. Silwood1]|nr:unnamed protein product [Rotaria sp. Silwood1]CAF3532501.1 unnamed protein product [Rotaria sp. Silwood1]CAF3588332.1 unnamed protein product [Rotaria sp. Silwood1]CAF4714676.1 unnamed protein product [Rotaria sp. Silwood1]CAF4731618.1 unnamed protein product [Rotaria sp. Silwood1]
MQYPYYNQGFIIQRQLWQETWPRGLMAFIATCQMLLTFTILGIETWSMGLSIRYSFLFIGYSASFFFTITWISTYTVACCNRGSQGCATHALVENILSIIASCVLLYYDTRFLHYPLGCFWEYGMCNSSYWSWTWSAFLGYSVLNIMHFKLIAIKIQLTCAALMLALGVLFFLSYLYVIVKVRQNSNGINPQPVIELKPQQGPFQPPPNIILGGQPPSYSVPSYY